MLKKYRAKTITSFQKLSIRSHYDYSQIYLEVRNSEERSDEPRI